MTVLLSPVGGVAAQFFDNNGNPLSGGKLFSYAAGTTTPAATYTSSLGTTAHTNPIVLDSGGRVPGGEIWLTDGVIYKFVLQTSTNVLIATYDNIVGVNSNFVNYTTEQEIQTATAGQTVFNLTTTQYQPGTNSLTVYVDGVNQYGPGAQYAYLETDSDTVTFVSGLHVGASVKFTTATQTTGNATDASVVSYTPPFTGSVITNVEDKLAQTVSVKDFGAVGDGVADDTAAIQAALDAYETILVPNGTYRITSSLIYTTRHSIYGESKENTTLVGDNCDIVLKGAAFLSPPLAGGDSKFEIRNITICGGWVSGSSNLSALYIMGYDYIVENIDVYQCGDVGIYATCQDPTQLTQATEHIESYITQVKIWKCRNGGLNFDAPTDSYCTDVVVIALADGDWPDSNYSATNYGMRFGPDTSAMTVTDSHVYGNFEFCYKLLGAVKLIESIGEGAKTGQVAVLESGCTITGGKYFSGYNDDGTSWRVLNQGIVIGDGSKLITDTIINTRVQNCNQGSLILISSGGNNIYTINSYATSNGGAAAVPVQVVGTPSIYDTLNLTYVGSPVNRQPFGVAWEKTEQGKSVSSNLKMTSSGTSVTVNKQFNIFSVVRTAVGTYEINLTVPYKDADYFIQVSGSAARIEVFGQANNQIYIGTYNSSGVLADGFIAYVSMIGALDQ